MTMLSSWLSGWGNRCLIFDLELLLLNLLMGYLDHLSTSSYTEGYNLPSDALMSGAALPWMLRCHLSTHLIIPVNETARNSPNKWSIFVNIAINRRISLWTTGLLADWGIVTRINFQPHTQFNTSYGHSFNKTTFIKYSACHHIIVELHCWAEGHCICSCAFSTGTHYASHQQIVLVVRYPFAFVNRLFIHSVRFEVSVGLCTWSHWE